LIGGKYFGKSFWSQVVRNLVSNGLKFTSQGGCVKVNVSYLQAEAREVKGIKEMKSNSLVISVEDTGVGISEVCDCHLFLLYIIEIVCNL
jgi:signal transduction histidine kinase